MVVVVKVVVDIVDMITIFLALVLVAEPVHLNSHSRILDQQLIECRSKYANPKGI